MSEAPAGVDDPRATLDEFEALIAKWTTILTDEGVAPLEDFARWPDNVMNGPEAPYQGALEQIGK